MRGGGSGAAGEGDGGGAGGRPQGEGALSRGGVGKSGSRDQERQEHEEQWTGSKYMIRVTRFLVCRVIAMRTLPFDESRSHPVVVVRS